MRNDYKHLYGTVQVPPVQTVVAYADPVRADEERRASAARITKQQAKLRREKLAERWIVFAVALMMTIAMLPVLVVVGVILLARAPWQRRARDQLRHRFSLTTNGTHMPAAAPCHRGSREFGTPSLCQDSRKVSNVDVCAV